MSHNSHSHHPVLRSIVFWCPDWPVIAAMRANGLAPDVGAPAPPVALIEKGQVFACSTTARREGVRRGLRVREAQSRCPDLTVLGYEASVDIRSFEPVLTAVEELMPGVQVLRPGMGVIRSRGPSRFYGGDEEAGLWLLDTLDALGIDARVGIADGPFTAEHAARNATRPRIRIVPEGGSAGFLAPLSVGVLDRPQLTTLLRRLGVATLGEFAELDALDVAGRFGQDGAHLHALAGGLDSRPIVPRTPSRDLDSVVWFEPPLDRIDQVAFGFRASADRFIERITAAKLVCTSIRVEIDSDAGETSERTWLHPRSFTPADVIDRIRWQLQAGGGARGGEQASGEQAGGEQASGEQRGGESTGDTSARSAQAGFSAQAGLSAPISYVRVIPESVDAIAGHEQGLWGTAADERIHHALSRVQSMLGHDGVLTAVVGGGRTLLDRQNLVPWGDRPVSARPTMPPWPGRLPDPAPSTVFETRHPVTVVSADGGVVTIDERGALSGVPVAFSTGAASRPLVAWAGPWPVDERWWADGRAPRSNRFQVVDDAGLAWLLVNENDRWWAEARYD